MKRPWPWILLAVAAVASLGLWLARNLERVERQEYIGYQGEARTNDFLAFQRLLERVGHPARSIRGLPAGKRLPDPKDVLVLPRRRLRMTAPQARDLLAWVERGGLLVTAGAWIEDREAAETQDPLFAALGARLVKTEPPKVPGRPATPVRVNGVEAEVAFSPYRVLQERGIQAVHRVEGQAGIHVLHAAKGRGDIFLCSDLDFLSNARIPERGHADFAAALASRRDPGHRVWIVHREEATGFLAWLAAHTWPALLGLGLLLLAAFARLAPRFGPPLPDPEEARRSLAEHLAACGRFAWRHGDGAELLQAAREAALQAVFQAHPSWARLETPELARHLAEGTGIPPSRVSWALGLQRAQDPLAFTQALHTLNQIRKQP